MITLKYFNSYIPEIIVNNGVLADRYNLREDHVSNLYNATGIKERRYAAKKETVETMVTIVVEKIIEQSGISKEDIGALIIGTLTATYYTPGTAAVVATNVGLDHCFAYDLSAACAGWTYGIHQAKALIEAGSIKHAIVIGSEKLSGTTHDEDYKTAFLFGDGAAGCLISLSEDERGLMHTEVSLELDHNKDVYIKSPFADETWTVPKFHLLGKAVYEHGVELVVRKINEYFAKNNLSWSDFNGFIPHQANGRMLQEICSKLNVPEGYLYTNIEYRGNTGATSIPLCISEMQPPKGRYLLVAIGAGYTFGLIDTFL